MKWCDKSANGCKKVPCEKLHPLLCPRSLDLKCYEQSCDIKLHTSKCKRASKSRRPFKESSVNYSNRPSPWASSQSVNRQPVAPVNNFQELPNQMCSVVGTCHYPLPHSRAPSRRDALPYPAFPDPPGPQHFQQLHGPRQAFGESPSNFQQGCAASSPSAHQLLEVWAASMAKEVARQSEMTRDLLVSSVQQMSQHLANQGIARPQ